MNKICSKCLIEKDLQQFTFLQNRQKHRADCKICQSISRKKRHQRYYQQNKEQIIQKEREYCLKNRLQVAKRKSAWHFKNIERRREHRRIYERMKRKTNVLFRLKRNLRSRVSAVIRRKNKSISTMKLLGCSIDYLKQHLESQFQEGMNWGNYGKWHVDHVKPCAIFDLTQPEQQRVCFHYSNLQPLWAEDNLRKGAKETLRLD